MRNTLTTAAELVGATSITIGAALIAAPLGFIVAGVILLAGSILVARGDAQ
jgi:hypothetical protein